MNKKSESCKLQDDCFAYHEKTDRCMALNALYCKKSSVLFIRKIREEGIRMEGSREAEMIVTFALEGINYACRLSGAFAKNIAAMIAAVAKTPGNSPGKTRMKQLMQSGEPLDYYVVPEAKMKEFAQLAKKYGIQYCVAMNQDGAYDLIVKKSDSPRINRIAEHLGIGQVQGGINMDVNEEEKANATNITPEQELMQDMMSPNKNEREHDEVNFNQELSEEEPAFGSSSTSFNQRESVMDQVNNYQQAQESARDMFAGARSLREASMSDLPDGAEPIVVDIGWDRPVTRYNENGEQLFRGKTAEQMNDVDKIQYMVDQEMLVNGKLSEDFIRQMYVSGYRVDENGIVSRDDGVKLTSKERQMIADMMREPERGRTAEKSMLDTAAATIKEVTKHETRQ